MIKDRIVVGSHAHFFATGLAYTIPNPGGNASRTAKPGPTDPAWLDLGEGDWKKSNTGKTVDFMAPAPGIRVLKKKIPTTRGLKLKGKLMEVQNLIWQMLLSTATLPASPAEGGQYNPLAGDPFVEGWLKIQQYNQANELINTMDVFVVMNIPGDVDFGEGPVDIDVEADVCQSTLNSGTLA